MLDLYSVLANPQSPGIGISMGTDRMISEHLYFVSTSTKIPEYVHSFRKSGPIFFRPQLIT